MRYALCALALAGCVSAPPVVHQPQDILPCVYMVATPFGVGSATVVQCVPEEQGYRVLAVTAKHVVRHHKSPGYEIHLVKTGRRHRGGVVKAAHESLDVALLEFRTQTPLPVARVFWGNLEPFEKVYGAGFAAMSFWVSEGRASATDRATIHAAPGDSGGAVFNERGELCGVISRLNVMRRNNAMVYHHVTLVPIGAFAPWLVLHL